MDGVDFVGPIDEGGVAFFVGSFRIGWELVDVLEDERIAAFSEYIEDVKNGAFPEAGNLIEMDPDVLEEVKKGI